MGKVRRIDFFPDEFLVGTAVLSLEESGAYIKVISLIYSRGGPIDDDERWLSRAISADVRSWRRLRGALIEKGKLTAMDGKLSNRRCDEELSKARKRIDDAHKNGAEGGRPPLDPAQDRPEISGTSAGSSGEVPEMSAGSVRDVPPISTAVSFENNDIAKAPGLFSENLTSNHQPPKKKNRRL
jgi:uncharacterized protein YdaU (DUF1376 family)